MDCEQGYNAGPCQPPAERVKAEKERQRCMVPVLAILRQILVFVGRKICPGTCGDGANEVALRRFSVYFVDIVKCLKVCVCVYLWDTCVA